MQEVVGGSGQSECFHGQFARRELKGVAQVNERVANYGYVSYGEGKTPTNRQDGIRPAIMQCMSGSLPVKRYSLSTFFQS